MSGLIAVSCHSLNNDPEKSHSWGPMESDDLGQRAASASAAWLPAGYWVLAAEHNDDASGMQADS